MSNEIKYIMAPDESMEIIGWAVRTEDARHQHIEFFPGCSRETAVSIARDRNAEWARPYAIRKHDGMKIVRA